MEGNSMKGGAYTALITPFAGDHLDTEGLVQLIERQIEAGIDGVVVLGSTGEAATHTALERRQVIQTAVATARGRCAIVVGTGSNSTLQTLELTREAQELGADGALVVTPYYNKPSQEGIYRHFEAVSKLGFPIIIYNVASRTGRNIEPATLRRMSQLPHMIGVKESSGDIGQISEVVAIEPYVIWSGDDYVTLPLMALGGHGVISVVSNLAPKAIVELVRAARKGDWQEARRLHHHLWPLYKGAFLDTNPNCIKTMMEAVGLPSGGCRLPLCEPAPALRQQLAELARHYA
jgi:4-hydroxy-tetrahydrodipicolinate synthase